jgi:flagellar hook assembly protein FlgD
MSDVTRIRFTNAVPGVDVTLRIFDVAGRVVRTFVQPAALSGVHEVTWDRTNEAGRAVAGGLYFYQIAAGGFTASRQLVVTP